MTRVEKNIRPHVLVDFACPACCTVTTLRLANEELQKQGIKWACDKCNGIESKSGNVGKQGKELQSIEVCEEYAAVAEQDEIKQLITEKEQEIRDYEELLAQSRAELERLFEQVDYWEQQEAARAHVPASWITAAIDGCHSISVARLATILLQHGAIKHANKVHNVLAMQRQQLAIDGYRFTKSTLYRVGAYVQ